MGLERAWVMEDLGTSEGSPIDDTENVVTDVSEPKFSEPFGMKLDKAVTELRDTALLGHRYPIEWGVIDTDVLPPRFDLDKY